MNQDPKNDKDQNKLTEEEINRIIEELKKQQKKPKKFSIALGFMLHKNFLVHMILSFVLNLLIAISVVGLAIGINAPIMTFTVIGFILAMSLLTVIENFVKILMFKYFSRIMILSMGLLSVTIQIIILFLTDLIITEGFQFNGIEQLIVFSFVFSILRLVVSIYIRKLLYNEQFVFLGGK